MYKRQSLTGELIAEFLGTMVLILFGCGVVAMTVLFGKGIPGEVVNGGYTNITLGWGYGHNLGADNSLPWNPSWEPAPGNDAELIIKEPSTCLLYTSRCV